MHASYFLSKLLNDLEAYATGLSLVILPWESIPHIANPDASVVKMKGCEKSALCKTGLHIIFPLKVQMLLVVFLSKLNLHPSLKVGSRVGWFVVW